MFTSLAKGLYECISDSGKCYICDVSNRSCTCKAWYYKHRPCKHLKVLGVKNGDDDKNKRRHSSKVLYKSKK